MSSLDSNTGPSSVSSGKKEKHPLSSGFTFWYLKKDSGRGALQTNYQEQIKKLATFSTVEDFWAYYSHMIRPNDLSVSADYNLFRDGIVPMWEDPANRNGGKWVVRLKKGMASRCWEDALLALIGDEFQLGDEMCGVVLSTKFQEDILSFWTKTADDRELTYSIRETIKRVLGIPANGALEYKQHQQAIKHSLATPPPSDRTIETEVYEKRERERDAQVERERERDAEKVDSRDRSNSGGGSSSGSAVIHSAEKPVEVGSPGREPRSWDRYSNNREQTARTRNWEQRGVRDWNGPNRTTSGPPAPVAQDKERDDGWQQVTRGKQRRDDREEYS